MSFGKMNVPIELLKKQISTDDEGFRKEEEVVIASVRAYREGRHGNEKWANRAAFTDATDLFRFRCIPGMTVTTDMVIRCSERRFEITSVEDVKGRGMYHFRDGSYISRTWKQHSRSESWTQEKKDAARKRALQQLEV